MLVSCHKELTAKGITPQVFFHLVLGGFKIVESGTTCDRVKTKPECEKAARELGICMIVQAAEELDATNVPPYCYRTPIDNRGRPSSQKTVAWTDSTCGR